MDFSSLFNLGYVAMITFGIVWAVGEVKPLDSKKKFVLSVIVAVLVGFIPANLGNEILNRVKDGFGIATGLAGFYQMSAKIAERI